LGSEELELEEEPSNRVVSGDDKNEILDHKGEQTFIDINEADDPDSMGRIVKRVIESAFKSQVIMLPECHIRVPNLLISKPCTIRGKPGTTLEITHGSILIDFD
jgi:hypothetical protein